MKSTNCMEKEFFVIKESCPVRNGTKRINQILDAGYNKINLNTTAMILNYIKIKHKDSSLKLLQK